MGIKNIADREFLDSGTVLVGTDAVIEIEFLRNGTPHQVALKFRTDGGSPAVRWGSPSPTRTVVHFANFPGDTVSTGGGVKIGMIAEKQLLLAFVAEPFKDAAGGPLWQVTYTLYTSLVP